MKAARQGMRSMAVKMDPIMRSGMGWVSLGIPNAAV